MTGLYLGSSPVHLTVLATGSEYYCVDKITEDLKIPSFFIVVCSPSKLSCLNFCCVEKDWPRQDSLDGEQFGLETQ